MSCLHSLYSIKALSQSNRSIERINLDFDGDDVNMGYYLEPQGFEKIRRITGYLVGTVDRFNDAKRAEERDRVKHM